MKKRLGAVLLSLLLGFGGGVSAYAQTGGDVTSLISSYFANINSIEYNFKVYSDGEAYYTIYVDTISATKISVYMELQQQVDSSWVKVKGSTQTKSDRIASFYDSEFVITSGIYRVYYKTMVYYGDGQSETTTKYKYY